MTTGENASWQVDSTVESPSGSYASSVIKRKLYIYYIYFINILNPFIYRHPRKDPAAKDCKDEQCQRETVKGTTDKTKMEGIKTKQAGFSIVGELLRTLLSGPLANMGRSLQLPSIESQVTESLDLKFENSITGAIEAIQGHTNETYHSLGNTLASRSKEIEKYVTESCLKLKTEMDKKLESVEKSLENIENLLVKLDTTKSKGKEEEKKTFQVRVQFFPGGPEEVLDVPLGSTQQDVQEIKNKLYPSYIENIKNREKPNFMQELIKKHEAEKHFKN